MHVIPFTIDTLYFSLTSLLPSATFAWYFSESSTQSLLYIRSSFSLPFSSNSFKKTLITLYLVDQDALITLS